ncbi:MAG: DUF11 domain-containing protein, partial [Holophagales bacterium]|nr:DUF11 domain-containing protein [Holophagales bacterium]
ATGSFVVVWESFTSVGSDPLQSIQGRRMASDGSFLGADFQVNTYTTGLQYRPDVAVEPDGDFVVVWDSEGSAGTDTDRTSIQGQRFASGGSVVGTQFQINTYTTDYQFFPSVAVEPDGDFAVVWHSHGSAGTDPDRSIAGRLYASDGSAVGEQFQVNTYTTSLQTSAGIALDAGGNFVVTWDSDGSPGDDQDGTSVQAQLFAPDADLGITKDDGVTAATPGGSLTYTIVASNAGPGPAAPVSVADTFPGSLACSWTSVAAGGATGNSSAAGNLADTLTMPVSSSVTYTVTCDIDPAATGILSNTATISSAATDPVPADNSATDGDTALVATADLSLLKTGEPNPVALGNLLQYTLTVDNLGPSDSTGGTVTDELPPGIAFESSAACTAAGQTVTCPVPPIPAMGSVSLSFEVRVSTALPIVNTATLVGNEADPTPDNDASTAVIQVGASAVEIPTLERVSLAALLALLAFAGLYLVRARG